MADAVRTLGYAPHLQEGEDAEAPLVTRSAEEPPHGLRRTVLLWALCVSGAVATLAVLGTGRRFRYLAGNPERATSLVAAACQGPGEDCHASGCCRPGGAKGLKCYEKDKFWAECLESCSPGVHKGEKHGSYDKFGNFKLDEWSCKELSNRSDPGCQIFEGEDECPASRCMWKGSCMEACDSFPTAVACSANDKCMWKGKCMEACASFDTEETCRPTTKCVWQGGKCLEGCWTFGTQDSCPSSQGCIWNGTCVKDPCSAPGEDCRSTKCCSQARGGSGMTCFKKDATWASCMEICGTGDSEDWACDTIGNRTKFSAGCAWAGKSCVTERLCCNTGFTCAKKDETWTACVQTVKKTTWMKTNVPLPAGWDGTILGPGRNEYAVQPAKEGDDKMGTRLYCFIAFLPDSYEVELVDIARKNKASVFGCDSHDLFHSWKSKNSVWDTGAATLTNTDVFINVWEQVHKAGNYLHCDWTIKVDADCVMVPARMRTHLAALNAPAYIPIYVKNNDMDPGLGNNGFLGAVEVFNKKAVQIYFDNYEGCQTTMGLNAGEDGFFKGCMDALGVGFMADKQMFFPDHSAKACNQGQRAAYHPLKRPDQWQHCWNIVLGKVPY